MLCVTTECTRVTLVGYTSSPEGIITEIPEDEKDTVIKGISGELVRVLKKPGKLQNDFLDQTEYTTMMAVLMVLYSNLPDLEQIKKDLQSLYDEGYRSIAVCLMHSYTYPGMLLFSYDLPCP